MNDAIRTGLTVVLAVGSIAAATAGLARQAAAERALTESNRALETDRQRADGLAASATAGRTILADLENRRVAGVPDPAALEAAVDRIRARRGIPAAALDPPAPAPPGVDGFSVTPVALRLVLLHEQDLLDFLADFATDASGWIAPRRCRLRRSPAGAGIEAECSVDWILFPAMTRGRP